MSSIPPAHSKKSNRRSKMMIDARMQRTLAFRMVLHCLGVMIIGGIISAVGQYLASPAADRGELAVTIIRNFSLYALAFLVLLPALMLDSFRLSNRIVGPIFRLHNTIRQLTCGGITEPLQFRNGDFWQDIPADFNRLIDQMSRDFRQEELPGQLEYGHRCEPVSSKEQAKPAATNLATIEGGMANQAGRRGAAVVEFALVAPLLVFTLFSSIEIGRALMATHSMEEAARSGCRVALLRGATNSQIEDEVDRILGPVGITAYTLQVEPTNMAIAPRWTPVTVRVTASFNEMSWLPLPRLFAGKSYSAFCTLPKEYSVD